ncbi:DUF58 domain-containing protein [Actinoallomurus acaciae]|uniref:DUF58 domain-containing protein n=1 Tax=Actinoallomurus acaciae TaxID=502577 RepID=A0ABV5YBH2_9ACTN
MSMRGSPPRRAETNGHRDRHALAWRPSPHARRLATMALLALLAAIAFRNATALLLAAPLLCALAAGHTLMRPGEIQVHITVTARRCFEDEDVDLTVVAVSPGDLDVITLGLRPSDVITIGSPAPRQGRDSPGRAETRWRLRPTRWGRHPIGRVRIECRHGHRMWQARLDLPAGELVVFPRGPRVRPALLPPDLPRWIGEHVSRAEGAGVEFAGIRPYLAGDRLRDINWKASGHRGRLHVTTRAAERQADIVVVIDARTEIGPPGAGTLDASVRGATAVASAYLRRGDRVGVVGLGGQVRWLAPGSAERQFYRIAECVLDLRRLHSQLPPDPDRVPRVALPPQALVIVFSPLLDEGVIDAILGLRRRGNPVLVIDVLDREPPARPRSRLDMLALRLWRIDRTVLRRDLAEVGITTIREPLDAAFSPRRRLAVPRRRR